MTGMKSRKASLEARHESVVKIQAHVIGIFAVALMTLPTGVMIVAFHNVWTGLPALLTIIGWGFCAKCLLYLVFPRAGIAALARISVDKPNKFVAAGVMLVVLSGTCWFSWLTRP